MISFYPLKGQEPLGKYATPNPIYSSHPLEVDRLKDPVSALAHGTHSLTLELSMVWLIRLCQQLPRWSMLYKEYLPLCTESEWQFGIQNYKRMSFRSAGCPVRTGYSPPIPDSSSLLKFLKSVWEGVIRLEIIKTHFRM